MTATHETAAPAPTAAPPRTVAPALLVAAILLLALNLRGPIVAVSPVTEAIRADLGIDAGTAGLLTSLPVLCFGLATPLASALLARTGLGRGVLVALGVLLGGTIVRSLDGLPAAVAGTLLIGAAITVGNVAVPVVIGRDLPRQAGAVLGMYTAALNIGSMITLSLTVPIAGATDWRFALASWGVLVLVAAGVWWWATRSLGAGTPADAAAEASVAGPVWWRRPVVWGLTIAFAGQAFAYFGVTAWLPLLLGDELGMSDSAAGVSSSVFQVAAIVGAFGVPVLLRLCPSPRIVVAVVCAAWAALPLGLLLAPEGWAVWCALGGAAQGGGITVIFSLVVRRARDLTENRRMSALVQGGGYTVAATGPSVVGAVHEATGTWSGPLLVVLAAVLVLFTAGLAASGRTA
ncbi:CynX/NimT family MFS transporter [Pseudonocardia halophobica]|uniref:MFS transporter n=1 Tax=Pseudonocardia halophobica TaxID=29401 RepID=A0A9W6L747_9PSEU|nr:MFS transporter [Pseudonocardia halophobica]GLL13310.1 MFS transporter [Pseudonocardia halophobica]